MLIVNKHCCDLCCNEYPVPQTDRKSKQVKERRHGKFYLHNLEAINMQFVCIFYTPAKYLQKIEFLIFKGSVATYLR